ncbi:MAG: hypothetical protein AAFN74_21945 [Myxococcota bacterium]
MKRQAAGFTLLELTQVVAGIGIFAAASVPMFKQILLQAKTAQAPILMHAVAHRIHVAREERRTVEACGFTPAKFPAADGETFTTDACWSALGFHPKSSVYYQLGIVADDAGHFRVIARSDLDEDEVVAEWTLDVDASTLQRSVGAF